MNERIVLAAPAARQVIGAIARREIMLASKRRLLRLLFLLSTLPPILLTLILFVRNLAEEMANTRLPWDPLVQFVQFQALPVALLALGLGTPVIARDRAEDVLFLYATRPVLPWHYALGRMLAVAVPAAALLLVPGLLIAILRVGVTNDLDIGEAFELLGRLAVVALLTAWGLAGVSVGSSAVTRRGRWAMLLALSCFAIPDIVAKLISPDNPLPLGLGSAVSEMIASAFSRGDRGTVAAATLLFYGWAGYWLIVRRVRGEMIP
jgi:ABC-type transport system involved in multi-copper enzyme maturation permease subunit